MPNDASDLSRRLSGHVLAVCRRYLSNGRREGAYWTVGDVMNTPGRSLHVRLTGPERGPGAAGHWADESTGEHGDLLDLIGLACGLTRLRGVMEEARAFLALPPPEPSPDHAFPSRPRAPSSSPESARRLFQAGQPIRGTLAAAYLAGRGLVGVDAPCLRFHPRVFYRPTRGAPRQMLPALLAAVSDPDGAITGLHRTWLDPATAKKAELPSPRRSMGHFLGNGVRFGVASDVLAAGEGIETILSLRAVLPAMPMVAATSANHLAALELPPALQRLYVARDPDAAGLRAAGRLRDRAEAAGIEVLDLLAERGDFNDDLRALGRAGLLTQVAGQLVPEDRARFAATLARPEGRASESRVLGSSAEAIAGTSPSSDRERAAPTAF